MWRCGVYEYKYDSAFSKKDRMSFILLLVVIFLGLCNVCIRKGSMGILALLYCQ